MSFREEAMEDSVRLSFSRRKFMEQSLLAGAALTVMPWWLSSCKKTSFESDKKLNERIIVVGAGISGLYAASLLTARGADVLILEASEKVGGRIQSLRDFASFPIDLGSAEIRGEKSVFYDLVRSKGIPFINDPFEDHYYFNGSIKNQIQAEENTFFNTIKDLRDSLSTYVGGDISAEAYGNIAGVNDNVKHIWNAWVGNSRGTSTSLLGMHGVRAEVQMWSAGDQRFKLSSGDFHSLLSTHFQDLLPRVSFNSVVTEVNYSGSKILVRDNQDVVHEADRVILTVPISILKSGEMQFIPPLPVQKAEAISKIGMDRGITVVMRFSEPFWPSSSRSIIGPGFVPMFRVASAGRVTDDHVLLADISGPNADHLASLGTGISSAVLGELDFMFGNASEFFVDAHIHDWGANPFIRGSVSYAKIGTGNARAVLSESVSNKVYFAGEAAHTKGHHGTIHGAMETAMKTVLEILNTV